MWNSNAVALRRKQKFFRIRLWLTVWPPPPQLDSRKVNELVQLFKRCSCKTWKVSLESGSGLIRQILLRRDSFLCRKMWPKLERKPSFIVILWELVKKIFPHLLLITHFSAAWSFQPLMSAQAGFLIGARQPSGRVYWSHIKLLPYPTHRRSKHHEGWGWLEELKIFSS